MSHVAGEAFAGHRIVKAFGAEAREAEKFEVAARSLYRTNMKVTRVLSMLPPLMELLGGFAIAGALWYGTREIASGRLTAGEFTMFVAALLLMYGPVKKLSRVNANLQQAVGGVGADLRAPRHAQRGAGSGPGAAAAAVPARHRLQRRRVRLRRRAGRPRARRRELQRPGRPDGGDRRAERRRQDHARQPAAAVLRRHRRARSRSTGTISAT